MLQVEDLSFSHPGGSPLLQGVGFTMRGGSTLCLLGPNGGGKTTLLRCVLGLEKLHAGRVLVDGQDLAVLGAQRRARLMAYVPQLGSAAFPFTVFDVTLMGRSAHLGFMADPGVADRQAAADALARLGIGALAQRLFNQLSGGERQLVLLARALAQQSRLLVLDEPCTGLDLGHQVQVLQALRSLAGDGYAILLSTHLPEQAFALNADVALLHHGHLRGPAPASQLLTAPELTRLYGTPISLVPVTSGPARGQVACVPVIEDTSGEVIHEHPSTGSAHLAAARTGMVRPIH